MSVYSNKDILAAIEDGTIVCTPFNPKNVSEASLDFTLGFNFYKQEYDDISRVYNPFDESDVNRYFKGPLKAIPHAEWCERHGFREFKNIPSDHPIIVLKPGERILAHTHVCFDAGWVDPGYINRITLEIYNLNKHESVVLPVGERIGQLIFHHTGQVDGGYASGRDGMSGKYQHTDDLDELIKTWRPEMMLPRAFKDRRHKPMEIAGLSEGIL